MFEINRFQNSTFSDYKKIVCYHAKKVPTFVIFFISGSFSKVRNLFRHVFSLITSRTFVTLFILILITMIFLLLAFSSEVFKKMRYLEILLENRNLDIKNLEQKVLDLESHIVALNITIDEMRQFYRNGVLVFPLGNAYEDPQVQQLQPPIDV